MTKARRPGKYDRLSAATGISRRRLYNRRDNPQDYTLEGLETLARVLHIPAGEMRDALFR